MSERRSKAESGEGAQEDSSQQGQRRPSDPLHSPPPHQSYYSHPQQSAPAHYQYHPSSTREGISYYASHRARSGSGMPPHRGPPPPHHYGPPPVDPRAPAQQVTPDTRQQPIPSEFMSPPSSVRRRYTQSPPTSSKSAPKRPRRSGTFLDPDSVEVHVSRTLYCFVLYATWCEVLSCFLFCASFRSFPRKPKFGLLRRGSRGNCCIQLCTNVFIKFWWAYVSYGCILRGPSDRTVFWRQMTFTKFVMCRPVS